ncbi:MAG TPA: hypothetical protein VGV57_14170, partial [Thermoleophilaceae bacterium]|nr:hypothetical protein [Thermoleophilaceae bacterium]
AQAETVPRSRPQRLAGCKRRLEEDWQLERRVVEEHAAWHARGIASDGSRRMAGARANIKPYPAGRAARRQAQRDRPRLAQLEDHARWVQGYNAQAAVTAEQIVVAAEAAESMSGSARGPEHSCPVRWGLTPYRGGTWVDLSAELEPKPRSGSEGQEESVDDGGLCGASPR